MVTLLWVGIFWGRGGVCSVNRSCSAAQYRAAMQISKPEPALTDSNQTVEKTGHLQ